MDKLSDRDEFADYFHARLDLIRRSAFVLCGDWHHADDLAQDALIRLAASWHRIREPAAIDAYVRTCLIRAYLAESKRAWRRRESTVEDVPERATPDDVSELVAYREMALALLRDVAPRQRAVLVCRYFWDLDVAETARVLGCSEGNVKSQAARALAGLRMTNHVAAEGFR